MDPSASGAKVSQFQTRNKNRLRLFGGLIIFLCIVLGMMLYALSVPLSMVFVLLTLVVMLGAFGFWLLHRMTRENETVWKYGEWLVRLLDDPERAVLLLNSHKKVIYFNPLWEKDWGVPSGNLATDLKSRLEKSTGPITKAQYDDLNLWLNEDWAQDTVDATIAFFLDERRVLLTRRVFTDVDKRVYQISVTDITDSQRKIDALSERVAITSHMFDFAPFGIAILDQDFQIVEANASFQGFCRGAPVHHQEFLKIVAEDDREAARKTLEMSKPGDETSPSAEIDLAGLGDEKSVILYASCIKDEFDKVRYVIQCVDATEQKKLENQFVQSQKMQAVGQLAGGVAHDFNNMLTAMIGFCDLLLQRHQPGDPSFADIIQIQQNANRAAGLVRQLLAFSRRQEVAARVINLSDMLGDLTVLLRRLLGEKVELSMYHGRDLGRVRIDQGQLEQVIINLAVNSRDAMVKGGRLDIQTDNFKARRVWTVGEQSMPIGDYVMIAVTDTGIGMDKDMLDRIFEPFFTTKEVGEGTGLGLAMVYGTIQQAGGYIFANSPGKGLGASFNIYLPRVPEEEWEKETLVTSDNAETDVTGGGDILLVEDEDPVRLFAARALRSKGYKITEARTGELALEILEDHSFDLIVTDMIMPKVGGDVVIKEARKKHPDIPVICISGYTQESVAKEIQQLPKVFFLPKPFSLKQLALKVKDALESA